MSMEQNHNNLAHTQSGYDQWAPVYDCDGNPMQALEQPRVRALLGDVKDKHVLDMGCGTGRHALWCAEHGADVTAIDFSQGMLDQARHKPHADKVHWRAHDLHVPMPYEDGAFDAVVSGLVLEHIRGLDLFFSEAARVIKPEGQLVVSAMHPAMFLRNSMARFTDPDSGDVVTPGSLPHSIADFLTAALKTNLQLDHIREHKPDADFAKQFPRAEKYIDWPMLVVMGFKA